MRFFSSPGFSLACAIFNAVFAANAIANGNATWAIVGLIFAGFCFNNYLKSR